MEIELTDAQIERQDIVDNDIYNLVCSLAGISEDEQDEKLPWDIEWIGEIRDQIQEIITDKKLMTEMEFYPFIPMETV
jgi:hypothetical protein